jgi:hypothetical protein
METLKIKQLSQGLKDLAEELDKEVKYQMLSELADKMAVALDFYDKQSNWESDGKIKNDRNMDDCSGNFNRYGYKARQALGSYHAFKEKYKEEAVVERNFDKPYPLVVENLVGTNCPVANMQMGF